MITEDVGSVDKNGKYRTQNQNVSYNRSNGKLEPRVHSPKLRQATPKGVSYVTTMAIQAQKKAERRLLKIEKNAGLAQLSSGRMRPPKTAQVYKD